MKILNIYLIGALLLIATSCTKVIDLKLGNVSGELVIEGNIVNTAVPQMIKLTTNVPFTNTNTYPPVTGATITVTDQSGNSFPFVEGPQGTYTSTAFGGIAGNTYTMSVLSKSISYTAQSTMPGLVTLDSITSKNNPFSSGTNPKKDITVYFQDSPGVANQYRFVMYVNNVQVKSVFAFNDQFVDGRYVSLDLIQNDIDIHAGDTATVEMQCIDQPVYLYWFTLSQQSVNGPGGGVTPTNPPTNITPTTLGYFSAHTTQTETIVAK